MIRRFATMAIAALSMSARQSPQESAPVAPPRRDFSVGERAEYDIGYGPFTRGRADMEITSLDTVRGRPSWHAEFNVRGGVPFFRVNDHYETWVDTRTISSLRYKEDIREGSYERHRIYQFLPGQRMVIEGKSDTMKTVEHPVDQTSILYFIRTIALPVGLDTGFYNYFMPDANPIRIRVLGRERIKVPAGEFNAVVIQPQIKAKGLFSEGGEARVWLSDDERHIILQMKSKVPHLPIGSLNLFLKSYRPAATSPSADTL
jgi:Protein of unknown function (DUF3108)